MVIREKILNENFTRTIANFKVITDSLDTYEMFANQSSNFLIDSRIWEVDSRSENERDGFIELFFRSGLRVIVPKILLSQRNIAVLDRIFQ